MTVQGNFQAQGMILQGPRDFNWAMFPLLKGASQNQVANPQTLSISQQSEHKREADAVHQFFANTAGVAKLAAGRLVDPCEPGVRGELILKSTKRHRRLARRHVVGRPFPGRATGLSLAAYAPLEGGGRERRSSSGIFKNEISLDELGKQLSDGWTRVPVMGDKIGRPGSPAEPTANAKGHEGDDVNGEPARRPGRRLPRRPAVGDALGGATEGWESHEIHDHFGGWVGGVVESIRRGEGRREAVLPRSTKATGTSPTTR